MLKFLDKIIYKIQTLKNSFPLFVTCMFRSLVFFSKTICHWITHVTCLQFLYKIYIKCMEVKCFVRFFCIPAYDRDFTPLSDTQNCFTKCRGQRNKFCKCQLTLNNYTLRIKITLVFYIMRSCIISLRVYSSKLKGQMIVYTMKISFNFINFFRAI